MTFSSPNGFPDPANFQPLPIELFPPWPTTLLLRPHFADTIMEDFDVSAATIADLLTPAFDERLPLFLYALAPFWTVALRPFIDE